MTRILTNYLRSVLPASFTGHDYIISSDRRRSAGIRALICFALLSLTSPGSSAAQSEWSTESLMRKLAEVKEATLTFVEYRTSTFLVDKVKLTGRMTYRAPDFILKSVETPFVEHIEIEGDRLSIEKVSKRGESTFQRYSITGSDVLSATVEGIRATISGDYSKLGENYEILLGGNMNEWTVTLVPRKKQILDHISKIAVSGSNSEIRMIETFDADGDETSLNLSYLTLN